MMKRRGRRPKFGPDMGEWGNSDGAKALAMWSNHGRIVKPGMPARSRSSEKRPATHRRMTAGLAPPQQKNGDEIG
jgi:hypothetical protein